MREKNLLEVKNLTVKMKKNINNSQSERVLKAVDNVSFSIKEGEILALAGESGCGKSMIALAIMGLLPQKASVENGSIVYKNQELTLMNEKELCKIRGKEISIIFQEYRQSLNPLMRVGKQIRETLELADDKNNFQDRKIKKRRVIEILHALGFDDAKKIYNAYPHQLSGGMCQRVMAAIAAIGQPKLLIADEPSTALDDESKDRILSLLAQMNRDYKTSILVISHDLQAIRQFCSRYLVMYAGKIVEEGPVSSLSAPLHPYTKALLGAIPAKEKKGKDLENIPGKVPSIEDEITGCPFFPRCKKAKEQCTSAFPPAVKFGEDRIAYCYFPEPPTQLPAECEGENE